MQTTVEQRGGVTLRRLGLLVVATLLALWVLHTAKASAGSYEVHECWWPQSTTAPDARTAGGVDGSRILLGIDCSKDGWGVWVRGWNPSGSLWGEVAVEAPPTTKFKGVRMRYHLGAFAGWNSAVYVMNGGSVVAQAVASGTARWGDWNLSGIDATRISAQLSCPPPGNSFCATFGDGDYDAAGFKDLDLLLVDSERPQVGLGGPLLDGPAAHGRSELRIDATDRGSGVRAVTVDVNGERVATPTIGCAIDGSGTYATSVRPCPDFHSSVPLETERPPFRDGQNTLEVCATDVSTEGDAHQYCAQRVVTVDNSCPDSSGAGGEALAIQAGLEDPDTGKLARSRWVRSIDGVTVRGSLAGPAGPPRGASVCVYETIDEPAGISQLVQVAKTRSDGTFAAHLPPGPSRAFALAYRYGDRQIGTATMYVSSSVMPTLKVTRKRLRNGRSVGFRGRLPGPNAAGRGVTLQAKVGKKWRTFKQIQSNDRGRFTGKYRFTQTRGATLYVFRALVKKQGGYPYARGASRKAKVLVRG